ncbi:MAG: FAD-binding protein [Bryobacteraceae bacterium]
MDRREIYDAIVIGSGAAGGWAAKELTERGLRTMLLEAGRTLNPDIDFAPPAKRGASKIQLFSRAKAVLEGQHIQARCMSFSPQTGHLFVSDRENPYETPRGMPFNWYRSRHVGGRLHLWGRNALRISDHDLHPAGSDGFGQNWPIGYAELAPWYEKVESFLGVSGSPAGIPNIPDGLYDRPHPITAIEQKVLEELKIKWKGRPATTCRIVRHNPQRTPLPIIAALDTGLLTLRSDAVVSHINTDSDTGTARSVIFIDRNSKQEHEVFGRAVVLCASTVESLRILLNSKSSRHPGGIGNSSGRLGHYLTDHVMTFQAAPARRSKKASRQIRTISELNPEFTSPVSEILSQVARRISCEGIRCSARLDGSSQDGFSWPWARCSRVTKIVWRSRPVSWMPGAFLLSASHVAIRTTRKQWFGHAAVNVRTCARLRTTGRSSQARGHP